MKLFDLPPEYCHLENLRRCCGWRAAEDANRVATFLGIQHFVVDLRKEFEEKVISDFCQEYARGRTPNPCIRCNKYLKFNTLMARAEKLGADYLVTGHHARIEYDAKKKRYLLKKGVDKEKDQSYFIYLLNQAHLRRILMPIGHLTKEEVREIARKKGLPVTERVESQEICFIPDNDYPGFLRQRIPEAFKPGPIVGFDHKILGKHKGIAYFTIGQRRGLGIAASHPLYVLEIRAEKNEIVVGQNENLYKKKFIASKIHLTSLEKIDGPFSLKAKIRYKHREADSRVVPLGSGKMEVEFKKAQRAITPGQSVVFYEGQIVVGGGLIERVLS